MADRATRQNTLHSSLKRFVNGGCLSRADLAFAALASVLPFRRNARAVADFHARFVAAPMPLDGKPEIRRVAPFDGTNPCAEAMVTLLAGGLNDALVGACVHGSVGSREEIAYSDFDALVILRDDLFAAPKRLADAVVVLSRARRHMFAHDPLQHHGWFVLCESDLRSYCSAYFPPILFDHAQALYPADGFAIRITRRDSRAEAASAFAALARKVRRTVERRNHPTNAYELKSLLSRFMLLPALYVECAHGRETFKRESFPIARADFADETWRIMDEVSRIRADWDCPMPAWRRRLLSNPSPFRRHAVRFAAPRIPASVQHLLTPPFFQRMASLAEAMIANAIAQGSDPAGSARSNARVKFRSMYSPTIRQSTTDKRP